MKRHTAVVHVCPCRHFLRGHTYAQGNKVVRALERVRAVKSSREEARTVIFPDIHLFRDVTLFINSRDVSKRRIALFCGSRISADAVRDPDRARRRQSTDQLNFVSVS